MVSLFGEVAALLPLIIVIVVINYAMKAGKEARRQMGASQTRPPQQAPIPPLKVPPAGKPAASGKYSDELSSASRSSAKTKPSRPAREVAKAATGSTEKASSIRNMDSVLMEDRKNDWLARQLREERRIRMRGDFLDLGASHDRDCDARSLKREHVLAHDDSIDNGDW